MSWEQVPLGDVVTLNYGKALSKTDRNPEGTVPLYGANGIKEYSDWPTIPQLFVNGSLVGGCDIVTELFQDGELQQMLEA